MAPGQNKPSGRKTLAEAARERDEKLRERVNAQVEYQSDAEENIRALAEKAYPNDAEEQNRYAGKIRASLEKYIRDDKTLEDLWGYLGGEKCNLTAIVQGILHFYRGEKVGEDEINLDDFLKPLRLPAESDLSKEYMSARTETILNTKKELTSLLEEIQAGQ